MQCRVERGKCRSESSAGRRERNGGGAEQREAGTCIPPGRTCRQAEQDPGVPVQKTCVRKGRTVAEIPVEAGNLQVVTKSREREQVAGSETTCRCRTAETQNAAGR